MHRSPIRRRLRAAREIRGRGLDESDAELLRRLDRDFREAADRAGPWLVCRPGCADCCHGPFPITRLDVRRLRRGLDVLERADPARAARVRERAARAVCALTAGFPGDARTGRLAQAEAALDAFLERHARRACPALDPASARCELYAWRPVACRTYGPPTRFGESRVPACDLCFVGATQQEIERCRMEPDREGLESALLEQMDDRCGAEWETLIAFALSHDVAKRRDDRAMLPGA